MSSPLQTANKESGGSKTAFKTPTRDVKRASPAIQKDACTQTDLKIPLDFDLDLLLRENSAALDDSFASARDSVNEV